MVNSKLCTLQQILDGLMDKQHNISSVPVGKSIVQGVTRLGNALYANSDFRKGGKPAGF